MNEPDKSWLLFAAPKAASRSIISVKKKLPCEVIDHKGYRSTEWIELYNRVFGKQLFVFLRHPLDRIHSAWRYLLAGGRNSDDLYDQIRFIDKRQTFDEFVKAQFTLQDPPILQQLHFRPMNLWMYPKDGDEHDWVCYRLDEWDKVMPVRLPHCNISAVQEPWTTNMDTIEILQHHYAEELYLYGSCV
jgi:hypothetical protein